MELEADVVGSATIKDVVEAASDVGGSLAGGFGSGTGDVAIRSDRQGKREVKLGAGIVAGAGVVSRVSGIRLLKHPSPATGAVEASAACERPAKNSDRYGNSNCHNRSNLPADAVGGLAEMISLDNLSMAVGTPEEGFEIVISEANLALWAKYACLITVLLFAPPMILAAIVGGPLYLLSLPLEFSFVFLILMVGTASEKLQISRDAFTVLRNKLGRSEIESIKREPGMRLQALSKFGLVRSSFLVIQGLQGQFFTFGKYTNWANQIRVAQCANSYLDRNEGPPPEPEADLSMLRPIDQTGFEDLTQDLGTDLPANSFLQRDEK